MKQLHKQSGTRRDEEIPISQTPPYSPKALKHPKSLPRSISYLLKEQRLLFILVGILIGSTFFILQPSFSHLSSRTHNHLIARSNTFSGNRESITYYDRNEVVENYNAENKNNYKYPNGVGRVPVGIGRKRKRIVVTGGAGFVGSHLVDKLIARGDDVIVIDNFFTGRKENVVHLLGNPRFELIRHDVVEPILLEVDQIYHLACPASPVHYKYNPVKTIISLILCFL
ncbi:UDP-glucuronic acid decarboxylase 1 [Forsythia ovata]|uniref:UDP-glucuronate decarboxylase n=1 Tax=Forsythia ovata TaxID=205694 RepID=A0ABD1SSU4_9LAMI